LRRLSRVGSSETAGDRSTPGYCTSASNSTTTRASSLHEDIAWRLRRPCKSRAAVRSAESQEEILRWGLFFLASQVAEAADEVRALRESLVFDELPATAKLSRDSEREREQEHG